MNVFISSTRIVRTINGPMSFRIEPRTKFIPNDTKNSVLKKSFNELTFPIICRLYGRLASVIPATNAPIAIEKPMK